MNEFSDRPFAVGSLMGVRSFRVTPDGVLTGCVYREPWLSGVNEATCTRGATAQSLMHLSALMQQMGVSGAEAAWQMGAWAASVAGRVYLTKRPKPPPPPKPVERQPTPEHQAATLDCTCGFYAYFDQGHNPHHEPGNVLGIVEGFGVCTVGTRGFRSSKARIRALIEEPLLADYWSDIRWNYPDVPTFPTLAAALAEFPLTVPEGTPERPPGEVTTSGGYITLTVKVDNRGWSQLFGNIVRDMRRLGGPTDETPQDRALRLRRERNTGPADRHGLDGRFRRRA
jgi:hypothetical protein